jgi:hypothetical protein
MTPEQMAELNADYAECRYRDPEDLPTLRQAENALRHVTHHPTALLPPAAAEMLLAALGRLHQVERAARALVEAPGVRARAPIQSASVRDALRANLGNGRSLNDEATS